MSSAEDEKDIAARLREANSKHCYSTKQLREYYLYMLEEREAKSASGSPDSSGTTCNSLRTCSCASPLCTCTSLHRTSSTCSSESLGESSPRKRRLPYAGITTRMVSRFKNRSSKPAPLDAFICYSRADGMAVAKSLSEKLKDCDYRIKMDTKNKPANSVDAINQAKYAIVILSPGFFRDEHAMSMLERLICRQLNRHERFILPLWHEVDERQVFESWPQMCDIFGLKTSIGVPAIVREFRNKIIHGSNMCHRVCQV